MAEIKPGTSPIPKQYKIDLLRKVSDVLNENNIDYFLTCGTLLGFIRNGDFIKWDVDIDMGVFDIDEVIDLENQFNMRGLKLVCFTPNHSLEVSLKIQIFDIGLGDSNLYLDFFEFNKCHNGFAFRYIFNRWYIELIRRLILKVLRAINKEKYTSSNRIYKIIESSQLPAEWKQLTGQIHIWIKKYQFKQGLHLFEPFTCEVTNWFGFPVKLPSNAVDHLRLLYGEEWYIPYPGYSQSLERQKNIRRVKL